MNTLIEEEGNGEETEVKEVGMPTREHLLQMLGMPNTLVDNVSDIEEPATKFKRCSDRDTLSHLGFIDIQVGGNDRDGNHENQD